MLQPKDTDWLNGYKYKIHIYAVYNAGDPGSTPGSGRSPGEGNSNPLQYSCLENPMDRRAWWATVHGVVTSWTRLRDFTFHFHQETHVRLKDTYRLQVRGWKNIFHANGKQKKGGVAILIADKIDLKIKKITRDKEGHYIMIKGSIQEEDITIVNIYAPNTGNLNT